MERKLQERLIGAGVLIIALVVVGPMILDGQPGRDSGSQAVVPGQRPDELRSQTFQLRGAEPPRITDTGRPRRPDDATAAPVEPPPAPAPLPLAKPSPPVPEPVASAAEAPPADAPQRPAAPPAAAKKPAVTEKPAAAEPKLAPQRGGFVVQVGTFGQKANAEKLAGTLNGRGFSAAVSEIKRDGRLLYRVRVGPPGDRDSAAALAARLAAAGHAGQVVSQ